MSYRFVARICALILRVLILLFCVGWPSFAQDAAWSTLRVAFYPVVPERQALFAMLEREFERLYPGVNVELVETYEEGGKTYSLADTYYNGGLAKAKADIYEVDTILLSDMLKNQIPILSPYRSARSAETPGSKSWSSATLLDTRPTNLFTI